MLSMDAVIPPSFSLLHDHFPVDGSPQCPYREGPEILKSSELHTFLALPTKKNTMPVASIPVDAQPGSFGFKNLTSSILKSKSYSTGNDFFSQNTNDKQAPAIPDQLDFKQILLPAIVEAVHGEEGITLLKDVPNVNKIWSVVLEEHPAGSRLILPTESSWYMLNQMRVHAGAPERSDKGVEKLIRYATMLRVNDNKGSKILTMRLATTPNSSTSNKSSPSTLLKSPRISCGMTHLPGTEKSFVTAFNLKRLAFFIT